MGGLHRTDSKKTLMGHPQTEKTRKKISRTMRGDHRGRPTVDTPELRQKIEEVAALDASVEEIAFYAGISRETYYQLIKKDKAFSDRIAALRQRPVLKARQTVITKLGESYQNAIDYLKRKKKLEFGDSSSVEISIPTPIADVRKDAGIQKDSEAE